MHCGYQRRVSVVRRVPDSPDAGAGLAFVRLDLYSQRRRTIVRAHRFAHTSTAIVIRSTGI